MGWSDRLLPPGVASDGFWLGSRYIRGGEGREVLGGVGRSWTGL